MLFMAKFHTHSGDSAAVACGACDHCEIAPTELHLTARIGDLGHKGSAAKRIQLDAKSRLTKDAMKFTKHGAGQQALSVG
jgi:hypothetical protein